MVEEVSLVTVTSRPNAEAETKTLRMVKPNDALWANLDGMLQVEIVPLRIATVVVTVKVRV